MNQENLSNRGNLLNSFGIKGFDGGSCSIRTRDHRIKRPTHKYQH
jgi:hypothetical protein